MKPTSDHASSARNCALAATLIASIVLALAVLPAHAAEPADDPAVKLAPVEIDGLIETTRVRRDQNNVPHIFALNQHDALFMLGYVHSQDRFFQMDLLRRTFSGRLAAVVGEAALDQDIQFRTLGLHRAAARTEAAMGEEDLAWMQAYVDGVNAWIAQGILPPEHQALELSSLEPWTIVDSITLTKGLAFGLSFDLDDLDRTQSLLAFQAAGQAGGFDGTILFFEDFFRSQPFDDALSIPQGAGTTSPAPAVADADPSAKAESRYLDATAMRLASSVVDRWRAIPALSKALDRPDSETGSNWWIADGSRTDSGFPLIANDPHLGLDTPSTFYEVQMRVRQGVDAPLNVFGVSFAGTPGIIQGCTPSLCWGSTVNALDVTDVYQEELVIDPMLGLPIGTRYQGEVEPAEIIFETYEVNQLDGMLDNPTVADVDLLEGGATLVVPRRNHGPVVAIDPVDPTVAFSVQYTGWGPTFETTFIRLLSRARTIEDFREALQWFDVGSQNWAVAQTDGAIAYFTSAEMPLRDDLQNLMAPDGGVPPFFVRDGSGALRHEWLGLDPDAMPPANQALPYQILPFEEMPQIVNPAAGYILNANNDPVGTTLDNDPLNQVRGGGEGLFYLSPGYASGFRQGRLLRLFLDELDGDGSFSFADFERFQGNVELLDPEILVPHLLEAFDRGTAGDADPALAALAADLGVVEAIERFETWDYSFPTGIPEGYDAGDGVGGLPAPGAAEIEASVAATIYSVWRGQVVQAVIDGTLERIGLNGFGPGSSQSMTALRTVLDRFGALGGNGASGVDFFVVDGVDDPADERDVVLLGALLSALDLLASDTFGVAFGNSLDQSDYRWGKLHRITFDHPLGAPFSMPPAAGFDDLDPNLPGVARQGGFGALDASAHSVRADGPNEFTFGSGPARRFVGEMTPDGPIMREVIPGGQTAVLGSPFYGDQLELWLVNETKPFAWKPNDVVDASLTFQVFMPAAAP
ncbi:MAG: penicillin acylase family protein [Acidobacteriota bacterium]